MRISLYRTIGLILGIGIAMHGAMAQQMAPPQIRLPLMQKAPVIDGIINPDEWSGADEMQGFTRYQMGSLAPQQAAFWVGADSQNVYIAMRSETPPGGKLLARANPIAGGAAPGAVFADDCIEVRIVPQPDAPLAERHLYLGLFNARGAVSDSVTTQRGGVKWHGNWIVKNSVADNHWDCEIALPWKDIGVDNPQGKTMAMRLGRDWRQTPKSIETDWGLGNTAFDDVSSMPRVVWDANAPVVQLRQLQNAPDSPADIHLAVANPGSTALSVKASIQVTPTGSAETNYQKNIDLPPGQSQELQVKPDASRGENLATRIRVTSADGNTIYYRRDFNWQIDRPKEIWNLNPEAAKRTNVQFAYFPSYNALHVKVDVSNLPNHDQVTGIALAIRKKDSTKNIATTTISSLKDNIGELREWKIPALDDGDYELLATPQGIQSEPVKSTFARHHFAWENNKYGTSDIVVPPFTPIKVQGNNVDVILRHYQTNGAGLWDQVTALDKPLLKSPMRLEATVGGKVLLAQGQSKVLSHKATQAITESHWQAGALKGTTQNVWDYDGVVKSIFTLAPTSQPVQSLTLVIPLDNKMMPLMHAVTFTSKASYSGNVPPGNGVVWKSSQMPDNRFIGNFVPYIWIGAQERGIAIFADNDAGWISDDKSDSQEIVRNADGTLELRMHLIQKTSTWDTPRQITIGFQATPAKPMPKNWRLWTVSAARTSTSTSKADVPGMLNQAFFASSTYWGGLSGSGDVQPDDGDLTLWNEFKRLRETGKADPTFLQKWSDLAYGKLTPERRKNREIGVNAGLRSMATQPQNVMLYTNARGMRTDTPDAQTFINEWDIQAFPQRQWDYATGVDYDADPVKSFRDHRAWWYHKSLEIFNDAIYWDCTFLSPNYNTITSAAYVRPDGQVQPSAGIWDVRDLVKRGAVLVDEMGKRNTNMVHMSGREIIPINDFAATQSDWELKYGEGDFQDKFPRDLIQAQTIGRQAGLVPIAILNGKFIVGNKDEAAWQYRTAAGVMLTHELKPWSSNGQWAKPDPFWENYDRLVEFGYGQPGTKVYNYWESTFPAKINGETSSLLVSKPGSAMLVLCDYGDGGDYTINLDTKVLSLNGTLKATNVETGEAIPVNGNTLKVNLKKHDFVMVQID